MISWIHLIIFLVVYLIFVTLNFMELLIKFWSWLKILPIWLRAIVLVLVAALALIMSMAFLSCGTPKTIATVQNVNPNSTVTVSMSVSNSTTNTTDVPPTINLSK